MTAGDAFHIGELITRRHHDRVEKGATACAVHIADAHPAFDRAKQHIACGLHMTGPGNDRGSEHVMGCRLEALPAALLAQFIANPTEAVSCLVVPELGASDGSQPDIGVARSFAVPTLDAETDRAAVDQAV